MQLQYLITSFFCNVSLTLIVFSVDFLLFFLCLLRSARVFIHRESPFLRLLQFNLIPFNRLILLKLLFLFARLPFSFNIDWLLFLCCCFCGLLPDSNFVFESRPIRFIHPFFYRALRLIESEKCWQFKTNGKHISQ